MTNSLRPLALLLLVLGLSQPALAGTLSALLGPPSLGQGGSNPVSIPPGNLIDWQASYRTDDGREWMVSVIPGLYYGQRFTAKRLTLGLGGGLLIGGSGVGLGLYQSVGYETEPFWKKFRLEVEYRQVIGYSKQGLEFPYTLRIGVSYEI